MIQTKTTLITICVILVFKVDLFTEKILVPPPFFLLELCVFWPTHIQGMAFFVPPFLATHQAQSEDTVSRMGDHSSQMNWTEGAAANCMCC